MVSGVVDRAATVASAHLDLDRNESLLDPFVSGTAGEHEMWLTPIENRSAPNARPQSGLTDALSAIELGQGSLDSQLSTPRLENEVGPRYSVLEQDGGCIIDGRGAVVVFVARHRANLMTTISLIDFRTV